MTAAPTRFLADEMLGKLARWMRFLGFDVEYARGEGDGAILAHARREERVLLTRDAQLAERAARDPGSLLLTRLDPDEQLREVVERLGLHPDPAAYLSRCGACNGVLVPADPGDAEAMAHVPADVIERAQAGEAALWKCPGCGRAYWPGSHTPRILRTLDDFGRKA